MSILVKGRRISTLAGALCCLAPHVTEDSQLPADSVTGALMVHTGALAPSMTHRRRSTS
jgi:hypothetical protein